MASAYTVIFTVLSTLALLSQGYAIDQSCYNYGAAMFMGVDNAMQEGKRMAELAKEAVTLGEDGYDNTREKVFKPDTYPAGTSQQALDHARAIQLGQAKSKAQPEALANFN
jgi:hypothetical protein